MGESQITSTPRSLEVVEMLQYPGRSPIPSPFESAKLRGIDLIHDRAPPRRTLSDRLTEQ